MHQSTAQSPQKRFGVLAPLKQKADISETSDFRFKAKIELLDQIKQHRKHQLNLNKFYDLQQISTISYTSREKPKLQNKQKLKSLSYSSRKNRKISKPNLIQLEWYREASQLKQNNDEILLNDEYDLIDYVKNIHKFSY